MDKKNLAQSPEDGEKAYRKIQERIKEGSLLLDRQIDSDEELEEVEADFNNWSKHNEMILSLLFDDVLIVDGYAKLYYDVTPRPSYDSQSLIHELPRLQHEIRQSYVRQYRRKLTTQIKYLQRIGDQLEFLGESSKFTLPNLFGDDVFVVHGHDEVTRHQVTSFIESLDLKAVVLDEQPNRGSTLLEKFEQYAGNAGFAIVLLTPDDIGTSRYEVGHRLRARQNVIFELGYFMGKLGRERVCPLLKGEIEMPSDVDSIFYVRMDSNDDWKLKLAQEMKHVGLPVDMNGLF